MPRINDSGNDPRDFCKRCFPKSEEIAEVVFGNTIITGVGPDNRGNCFGYEAEHPPYEDTGYECEVCHICLTEEDD